MNESVAEQPGDGDAPRPSPPASAGVLCPFCGTSQPAAEVAASGVCRACRNRMDPMARIATHNAMGPWFVRDLSNPFAPGCSYETLGAMCARGRVKLNSVVRGPTTQQFWRLAAHTPGVAVLLGQCHACAESVAIDAERCQSCDAALRPDVAVGVGRFTGLDDRQQLGLPPVRVDTDARDPDSALDSFVQAMGHAGSERAGIGHVPRVEPGGRGPVRRERAGRGEARLLWAGLLVSLALLLGLSLWAVVLPAMGVRTGVEEITGLAAARSGTARGGAEASRSAAAALPDDGDGLVSGEASVKLESRGGVPAMSPEERALVPPDDGVVDDSVGAANDEAGAAIDGLGAGVTERIRALHHAALSGELDDLRDLREAVELAAREAIGEGGVGHAEFAARYPELAALHAWAERAIAERMALDALGVR